MKKTNAHILIIDDQEDILFASKMILKKHFEHIFTLNHPRKALEILSENKIDVVLLDMNYRIGFEDGREGIYLLKEIKTFSPSTVVILMTAFGKVETAVEGLKSGAFDYILKPWDNEKLINVVKSAVEAARKLEKKQKIHAENFSENQIFIGESSSIQKAFSLAEKVAKTDANVLILGENGTGKSILAQFIHEKSNRKKAAFVHVDLGSLSENLFESELFGYAKGAFTDAKTDTAGRFEAANNGTIFLDEIGNVPFHLQSKLLQVIQNKSVIRLGETKPRPINVRIITATNAVLTDEISRKNFREDLFYRINTLEIKLPSLAERKEDILPMAKFLLQKMVQKYERTELKFAAECLPLMQQYPWKGNIREMENKIERAVILAENQIEAEDLDLKITREDTEIEGQLLAMEKIAIEKILQKHHFNISKSAEELGLSRAALYRRMEKFDLKN
ncbi:response regulator [Flavobacterium sp. NST-5]|uniref:Response regulator n=1 Tax=Flavobacterium ichthyis TaxID=2698827 RepID=A0ABW9ZCX2_9FLAO|nr:sigma-54 dependent transcriptional regulator [Flavobacterium ichthyis]NBL65930.1 response regulator [Flavobacterium ichthyis]